MEMLASWPFVEGSGCTGSCARASPGPSATQTTSPAGPIETPGHPEAVNVPGTLTVWRPLCRARWAAVGRCTAEPVLQQFGLVKRHQPMEVSGAFRAVFWKTKKTSRTVLSTSPVDIEKAFDQLDAWAVERSLVAYGAPEWAIAAVLHEFACQQARSAVAG